jgi:hypothetical protein
LISQPSVLGRRPFWISAVIFVGMTLLGIIIPQILVFCLSGFTKSIHQC